MTTPIQALAGRAQAVSFVRKGSTLLTLLTLLGLAACSDGGSASSGANWAALTPGNGSTDLTPLVPGNPDMRPLDPSNPDMAPLDPSNPDMADLVPGQRVICQDYDEKSVVVWPKTISIHNNSSETIYPVVATSKNTTNEWIQGCLRKNDEAFPTKFVYKLFVNAGQGLPPNTSVTITLPLFSLQQNATAEQDKYITWWNGGRVVLADKNERLLNTKESDPDHDFAMPTPATVTCKGRGTDCKLSTYYSNIQFPENVYAQLSEYTFGDSIIPAGQSKRLLKPDNVGYNISYVDHVYMPVAIGPDSNPYIGYSGSAQPLSQFKGELSQFLDTGAVGDGWPVYNLEQVKLPGGYNIFAQRAGILHMDDNVPVKPSGQNPPVLTVLKCIQGGCTENEKKNLRFGEAVQRIQNLWGVCVDWDGEDLSPYVTPGATVNCPSDLRDKLSIVKQFFKKNHDQYHAMRAGGTCDSAIPEVPFNFWQAITHIYGWVPFNEGCGAAANPLSGTSIPGWDHARTQSMYIHELQYNHQQPYTSDPKLLFNPYVQLIHDKLQMNAYGFSVDDAVGFMSELGTGLHFAVGGTTGLENTRQFSYADGFSLGVGVPQSMVNQAAKPLLKKYGVCALGKEAGDPDCLRDKQDIIMPTNSQIAGFRVGTVPSYPIRVRFTDLDDNVYSILVHEKFTACPSGADISTCPPNKATIVDKTNERACSVTDKTGETHGNSKTWCASANPNQQRDGQLIKNNLSFTVPVGYL